MLFEGLQKRLIILPESLVLHADSHDMILPESKVFFLYIIKLPVDDKGADKEAYGNGELKDDQKISDSVRLLGIGLENPF